MNPEPSEKLFKPYKKRLFSMYSLTFIESTIEMFYPLAIGLAINGLVNGGELRHVIPLVVLWVSQALIGALYQVFGARVVARIQRDISHTIVLSNEESALESLKMARLEMLERVCDALIEVVPMFIKVLLAIVVATGMLFFYETYAGFLALGLIVAIGLSQWLYDKKATTLSENLNTKREGQLTVITSRKRPVVFSYFKKLTRLKVKYSDAAATTWAVTDIMSLVALLVMLWLIAGMGVRDVGTIFAMVTYVVTLSDALEQVPTMIEERAYVSDVTKRLNASLLSLDDEMIQS